MTDVETWTKTLERNTSVLKRQHEDVRDEQSLQPLYPGSSSFNWMIGHLAVSRDAMLDASAAEKLGDATLVDVYTYGTKAPDASTAHRPNDLLALLERQGERLSQHWSGLGEADFDAPSGRGESSVADYLAFMIWHETYHLGQAALYRGALGLDSVIG